MNLSGFFLYQAKKAENKKTKLTGIRSQSETMLLHSSASQVMVLMRDNVVFTGAMAVSAFKTGDPSVVDLPYNSFPQFINNQMLRGLMLAPLNELQAIHNENLLGEIHHILEIIAVEEEFLTHANAKIRRDIDSLNLDIEPIIEPIDEF